MRCKLLSLLFIMLVSTAPYLFNLSSALDSGQNASITGQTVTGKATTQTITISVTVSVPPTLTLNNPKNQTYFKNVSLPLNYSVSNYQTVWYNLNNGTNITLSSSLHYFNLSEGPQRLYLFANNSNGIETIRNINFSVDHEYFAINFSNFETAFKGNTTDIDSFSFEECQNLSNIIFEHISFGKIFFPTTINLTNDANSSSVFLDINRYINISDNRIEIDSTALPNFNTTATLTIQGLNFTNPRMLFDGIACPSDICVKESYSSGILKFNVTHFSVYSADETPAESRGDSGGSSGGGGGGGGGGGSSSPQVQPSKTKEISDISLNPEKITLALKIGETQKREIAIKNNGNKKITLSLETEKLEGIISLREKTIDIYPDQTIIIKIDFVAREDQIPDTYIGKIILTEGEERKEILVVVDVSSKKSLFDVKVNIPKKYSELYPGEDLIANIKIFNLGRPGRVDVTVKYFLKNDEDEILLADEETVAIETQLDLLKIIHISDNLKQGNYILYIKTIYEDEVAVASSSFIIKSSAISKENITLYLLAVLIIAAFFIIFTQRRIQSQLIPKMRIDEHILAKAGFLKLKKKV